MNGKKPVICSACLLGSACRYDGRAKPNRKVAALARKRTLFPVCPEVLAGLPVPRPSAEIRNGRAYTADGRDVTLDFERGARKVLAIARTLGAEEAILKQGSPSCGCGQVYDGSFRGHRVPGDGITAKLLKQHAIKVKSEDDL